MPYLPKNWRKRSAQEVKGIFNLLLKIVKENVKNTKNLASNFFVLGNSLAFPPFQSSLLSKMLFTGFWIKNGSNLMLLLTLWWPR